MRWAGGQSKVGVSDALQQLSGVSIHATLRVVRLSGCYHFIPSAFTGSQPAPTGSSCRWTGVVAAMSCLPPRFRFSCESRHAWAVICCIAHAQCWSAGPATAIRCSRFLRKSSRFHSREIGNEKVRESEAPGKREPGNGKLINLHTETLD